MGRGARHTTTETTLRAAAHSPWDNAWRDRHPQAPAEDWTHAAFDLHDRAAVRRLAALITRGELPHPQGLAFCTAAGGCFDLAPWLAGQLADVGASADCGFYEPAGPQAAHHWVRLPDGTILDSTHAQFDPDRPAVVAAPGSDLYDRYIPYELMTAAEADAQFLDPPSPASRAAFAFAAPASRLIVRGHVTRLDRSGR